MQAAAGGSEEWQGSLLAEDAALPGGAVKGAGEQPGEQQGSREQQPLLTKSGILRLLAELIKSYGGCALQMTQHVYPAGASSLCPEVGPAARRPGAERLWR